MSEISLANLIEHFEEVDEMPTKQTDEKRSKNEADTLKVAEMKKRSLEAFSESNTRLRNELFIRKSTNTVKKLRTN